MPPGYALAIDGIARASNGISVWGSPDCPCCGGEGCPQWRQFVACQSQFACDFNGQPPHLYICATVTCTNGEPITIGDVVLVDGLCWEWNGTTTPTPPNGAMVYTGTKPVECVTGCTDERCPQGDYYIRAFHCDGNPTADEIWVCGVTRCVMRNCLLLDPARPPGPRRRDELPSNAIVVPLSSLTEIHNSCCDCWSGCFQGDLYNVLDPQNTPCIERPQRTCCCTREDSNLFVRGRVRILECSVVQIQTNHPIENDRRYEVFIAATRQDPVTRCYEYRFRSRITDLETGLIIDQAEDQTFRGVGACARCGGWPIVAPRVIVVDGQQRIVGFELDTWGQACQFDYSGDGIERSIVEPWVHNATCTSFVNTVAYRYAQPFAAHFRTEFRYRAVIEDGGQCGENCGTGGGAIEYPDTPDAPGAPGAGPGFGDVRDFIIGA